MKYTRKDYMDKKCTHEEYYAQFVTPVTKQAVARRFDMKLLVSAFKEDKNLNNLGGNSPWDDLAACFSRYFASVAKECGDTYSLCFGLCSMKAAARALIQDYKLT